MKKLLLITDAWAPQINGASRVAQAHANYLKARGWEVEVVHPAQFTNIPLPMTPDIRLALFARRRVRARVAGRDFDAVHIETEGPLGWAARAACLRYSVPFSTWYHTRFDLYMGAYIAKPVVVLAGRVLRRFHNRAARVMVSTPTLKATLEREGFLRVAAVPLGVDTGHFVRNLGPKAPELPKPVFAWFSRLAPEKSPEDFFKLDLPGTKLIIGDGPLKPTLERRYGATHMFVGFKTGQELVDWLSRADVLIFPSRTETFGLVVLEALACGNPVVAHDVLGPRDIITDGVDGYLTDDLKTGAMKALTLDRGACRQKALAYSWERATDAFEFNLVPVTPAV